MYVYRSDRLYCIIIIFIFLIVSYLASCMGFPFGWLVYFGRRCVSHPWFVRYYCSLLLFILSLINFNLIIQHKVNSSVVIGFVHE